MKSALARIVLRYLAAALVTYGIINSDIGGTLGSDPDVLIGIEILFGGMIAAGVEIWYAAAKRWGLGT